MNSAQPLFLFEGFLVLFPVLAHLLKESNGSSPEPHQESGRPGGPSSGGFNHLFTLAWVLCLLFYSLEYASRSAPSVMIPQLSLAFGTSATGVAALLGTYYYTYSATSLIAGGALDRFGPKLVLPVGFVLFGVGCLLFQVPSIQAGYIGRLCQGAGSAFAFTGRCLWPPERSLQDG